MPDVSRTIAWWRNRRLWRLLAAGAVATAALASAVHLLYEDALADLRPDLGLTQTVYPNPLLESPASFARFTTDLGLDVLRTEPDLPGREVSIRWQGYWVKTFDGPLRLYAGVDDEVRIWIDDRVVIDRSVITGFRVRQDPIIAARGVHRLRIEFVQRGGSAHLSVLWAKAGGGFRSFEPEVLFHAEPGAAQLDASARVSRLRLWRRVTVPIAGLFVVVFAVLAGIAAAHALRASPRARRAWSRGQALAAAPAVRRRASLVVAGGITAWTAWQRAPGLDPMTLWADDIWVAALTSLDSLRAAIGAPAPVPPGFLAIEWLARRLSSDIEVGLQVLPFVCGLAVPLVVFAIVARITSSYALGLVGLALASLDPLAAQVSVFVKQYTTDALIAVALLWLVVRASTRPPAPPVRLALAGLLAAPFSFPSLFLGIASVHVAAAWLVLAKAGRSAIAPGLAIAAAFDVLLAGWYQCVLRPRASPTIVRGWSGGFMPSDSLESAWEYAAGRSLALIDQALPDAVAFAAPLALLGLFWLLAQREWRFTGVVVAAAYAGVLLAAALRLYPVGTGYPGRVVLFSDGLIVCLAVVGLHALTRLIRRPIALNVPAMAGALALVAAAPVRVEYFEHDHSRFVADLRARVSPEDVVVLNARAAHLVSVYGEWPVGLVPDGSAERFHMRIGRPRTLTLAPAPAGLIAPEAFDDLRALLTEARPARAFFFTTRREFEPVMAIFDEMGYELVELAASTTRTRLMMYERRLSR